MSYLNWPRRNRFATNPLGVDSLYIAPTNARVLLTLWDFIVPNGVKMVSQIVVTSPPGARTDPNGLPMGIPNAPMPIANAFSKKPDAVTISISSPAVVSYLSHGLVVGKMVLFNTSGALPSGISSGTFYFVTSVTVDTFTISLVSGGSPLTTSSVQSGIHSLYYLNESVPTWSVVLLLHGIGANGGVVFTDSSLSAHVVETVLASVVTSTTLPKFGSSSMNFTSGRLVYADHDDWYWPDDFTVESWVNINTTGIGSGVSFFGQADSIGGGGNLSCRKNTADFVDLVVFNNIILTSTTALLQDVWYFIAVTRSGNIYRLFVNGVQEGGNYLLSTPVTNGVQKFSVGGAGEYVTGGYGGPYGERMCGKMAEFRVTKGLARYTSNFAVPTAAFS